jgi:hypothetical protein
LTSVCTVSPQEGVQQFWADRQYIGCN